MSPERAQCVSLRASAVSVFTSFCACVCLGVREGWGIVLMGQMLLDLVT